MNKIKLDMKNKLKVTFIFYQEEKRRENREEKVGGVD